MPLIFQTQLAGTSSGNKQQEWAAKLLGKTLTDGDSNETAFSRKDLPKDTRVIEPHVGVTMEHNAERLNISVDTDGIIKNVYLG